MPRRDPDLAGAAFLTGASRCACESADEREGGAGGCTLVGSVATPMGVVSMKPDAVLTGISSGLGADCRTGTIRGSRDGVRCSTAIGIGVRDGVW